MNTDQTVHTPVSNYFLPPILIHPPSLYTPPFLPECSSECFPFFTIHLFFCSIWVPLIGGGSGFPVLHTTLKNRLSEHFIFFSVKPIGTNSKKDYVYLHPSKDYAEVYAEALFHFKGWLEKTFHRKTLMMDSL